MNKYEDGSPLERLRLAATDSSIPKIVMNDRIRAYEPTEEDLYFTIEDGRYVNRIYSGVKLREFEEQKVKEFRDWITKSDLYMPTGFTDDHNYDLKFLNTMKYDH